MEIKNIDTVTHTWNGKTLEANETYQVQSSEKSYWLENEGLKIAIENDQATIDGLNKKNSLIYLTGAIVPQDLAEYKELKNSIIDARTKELIEQGFVYDSVLFSASETAQRNFMCVDQFRNDLTYPFGVSTYNDGEYFIDDAVEAHTFTLTALGTIEYHYATGRALKQQVNAAIDEAAVDAIQDNR